LRFWRVQQSSIAEKKKKISDNSGTKKELEKNIKKIIRELK